MAGTEAHRLGKLYMYLQRDAECVPWLQRCVQGLVRTHGRDHPLTASVVGLLDQAQAELAAGQLRL